MVSNCAQTFTSVCLQFSLCEKNHKPLPGLHSDLMNELQKIHVYCYTFWIILMPKWAKRFGEKSRFRTGNIFGLYLIYEWLFNLQEDTAISMNVKLAWRAGYTGKGVLVAVVDDGVNMNHPDLTSNFVSFLFVITSYSHIQWRRRGRLPRVRVRVT